MKRLGSESIHLTLLLFVAVLHALVRESALSRQGSELATNQHNSEDELNIAGCNSRNALSQLGCHLRRLAVLVLELQCSLSGS